METEGRGRHRGVDSPEQIRKCLECPYPYCYGRAKHGSAYGCRPTKHRTYESEMHDSGALADMYYNRPHNKKGG